MFTGMASPSFYIVFGAIVDNTGSKPDAATMTQAELDAAYEDAFDKQLTTLYALIIVATYTWLTWSLMIFGMNYAASRAAYNIRIEYF